MSDQVVELARPGLHVLLYSPAALGDLEEGKSYAARFPDGSDLVDRTNTGALAAIGLRWPSRDYWLHFSETMDHRLVASSRDHVRVGVRVCERQLCVRGGDDLFAWCRRCPGDQLVTIDDGEYEITACMMPAHDEDGPIRIYLHLARVAALADLGYESVPQLWCD